MIKKVYSLYKQPLICDTIHTTIWSTIGKAAGFLVPFFIAAWFGVSSETDAFFFAYSVILYISGIFGPVIEIVIVPYIAEARENNEDVGSFIGQILSASTLTILIFSTALMLIIKPLLLIITQFDSQSLSLIYRILIETSPLILFVTWTGVLSGSLNTYKKFVFPAISPAFRAIINIVIIFTFKDLYGVHAIAFGYIIGEFLRLVILFFIVKKLNLFKVRFSLHLDQKFKLFFKTALFQTISMVTMGLNPIIGKTMASWLNEGSVSIYYYAERLYMILITLMTTGIMVTLLSHWSERVSQLGQHKVKQDVTRTAKMILYVTFPVTLALIIFHQPIVRIAFGRGEFDVDKLHDVGWAWVCFLVGFVPFIIARVYIRGLLVFKKTNIILIVSVIKTLVNIVLSYLLMSVWQLKGIALSLSIASLVEVILYISIFNKIDNSEVARA